jgi:hypothetical protein
MADQKREPEPSSSNKKRGTDYRDFFKVMSRIVEEHPKEVAVVEEHLRRYQRSALIGGSFTAATSQHQEIVNALLETENGQAAAQTLGEAYRRMTEQATGAAGGPVQEIVPVIIGGLMILDILIWGCVFTDCI